MIWKSNIIVNTIDNNDLSLEEVQSPKLFENQMEDKENQEEGKDASITIDARSSEHYLQGDDEVIEV